jgi:paraquat-inducible protein B
MPDKPNEIKLPSAIAEPKRRWALQLIWIIPIIAILVGLNLAYKAVVNQGPHITIAFKSGDGLEAGKTVIQYKGVNIGLVKKIVLSEGNQMVIATAQLNKEAADFAREDTRFWIVRPRITAGGVSGLSTLLSGPFISAEIGQAQNSRNDFVALEVPPILTEGMPGREFILKAPTLGSHDIGTQVYFRRLVVGEVVAYNLDKNGRDISINVFINAPYDRYVTKNTRFWNASGIDLTVGATGIQLQTESLVAIVAGGIAFEAPQAPSDNDNVTNSVPSTNAAVPATELADANSTFQLFQTRALAMKQPDAITQSYIVNFRQSVKGLSVGAPVEFRGVNIGEVVSIGLSIDPNTFELVQPVEFSLYPQRLQARSSVTGKDIPFPKTRPEQLKRIKAFIDHGLRVQLRSSSLLTGQQYLAVDMFPDAPKYTFDISKSPLQMQYVPGTFDNIEQSIASTIKNTDALIKKIEAEVIPELSQSLKNINTITASESPLQIDIRDSLREISKAASSVKTLTDMLEQQPQSILFGKPSEGSK